MSWIRSVAAEVFGLFVDDGMLAVCIIVWVVLSRLALPALAGAWAGPVLFAGLAAILLESAARRARR